MNSTQTSIQNFWVDICHGGNNLTDERYYFDDLSSALEFYREGWRERLSVDGDGNEVGLDHKGLYSRGRLIHGHSIHGDADAKRIRMTALRVAEIRRFPDPIPAVEVYRRLGLDKESRAAQCQVSRDMKSGGFASRRVNGQWIWQRVPGKVEGQENIAMIATSHVSEHSTHISVSE